MSSGSSQIFEKLKANTLREALRDLGIKKWGNLTRPEMLAELKKLAGEEESSHEDEDEDLPTTSKSKSTAKPRKSLSAPGTTQKQKTAQSPELMDSISAAPTTRGSRRKAEESAVEQTRATRSGAALSHPPRKAPENRVTSVSKRKRGQPSPVDSKEEVQETDEEEATQPAKRTRQTTTISSRTQRPQDEPPARTTRSKGPATNESISSPVPRTTRTSTARKEPLVKAKVTRQNRAAVESISSPSRSTRSRATDTRMDVDESSTAPRTLRSHAVDSSPVRATRSRPQLQELQFLARTGSRSKTYVSRAAREARRRSRSAASGSEFERDAEVDDADVPVPSSDEEEAVVEEEEEEKEDEDEGEEEEEEEVRTSKKRRKGKGKGRATSLPEPAPKKARGRPRKEESPAPHAQEPKRARGRPRKASPGKGDGDALAQTRSLSHEPVTPGRPVRNRTKRPDPYPTYASPVVAKGRSENVVLGRNKGKGNAGATARGRPRINGSPTKRSGVAGDKGKQKQAVKQRFDGVNVPSVPYKTQPLDEEMDGDYDPDPEHHHGEQDKADIGGNKAGPQAGQDSSQGEADKHPKEPESTEPVVESDGEWDLTLADKVITVNGSTLPSPEEHPHGSQSAERPLFSETHSEVDEPIQDAPFALPQPRLQTEEPGLEREDRRDDNAAAGTGMEIYTDIRATDASIEHEENIDKWGVDESPVGNELNASVTPATGEGEVEDEKEAEKENEAVVPPPAQLDMDVDHPAAGSAATTPADEGAEVPPVEPETEQPVQDHQTGKEKGDEPQAQLVEEHQEPEVDLDIPEDQNEQQVDGNLQAQVTAGTKEVTPNLDTSENQSEDQMVEEPEAQVAKGNEEGNFTNLRASEGQSEDQAEDIPEEQMTRDDEEVQPANVDTPEPVPQPEIQQGASEDDEASVNDEREIRKSTELPSPDPENIDDGSKVSPPDGLDLAALHSRPEPEEEPEVELGEDEPASSTLPTQAPPSILPSLSDLHSRPSPGEEVDYGDDDNEYGGEETEPVNVAADVDEGHPRVEREEYDLEVDYEEADISQVPSARATPEAFSGLGTETFVRQEERDSPDADLDEMMNIDATARTSMDYPDREEGTPHFHSGGEAAGAGHMALVDDGSIYLNEEAFAMDTDETPIGGGGVYIGDSGTGLRVSPGVDFIAATTITTTTTTHNPYT